ncbi:hypothetical protein SNE40_009091 [Patella caerulea]|uniref:Kelch domain-containing protein 2 n=1 Tax=Patella caerulea TaxID=87958 RepID=A0AAN8JUB3_PATCE
MSADEEDRPIDNGSDEEQSEDARRHTPTISPRCGHITHCVGMNVLVWGGYKEDGQERYLPPEDVWVYNLELEIWSCHRTNGDVPPGMSGCCSCIYDNYLYIIGGHSITGNCNSIYKLNLKDLTWSRVIVLGELFSPRDKATAWYHNEKIYMFGGFGMPISDYLDDHGSFELDPSLEMSYIRNRGWNNQLLVFDVIDETWSNPKCKGVTPYPRAAHATTRVGDNVYIFGGRYLLDRLNDLHCLNLSTLTWSGELTVGSNVPCGRSWHTLTAASNKYIFLYGGYTQDNQPLSDAWVLDVNTLQWTQLDVPDNRPRLWHTACLSRQQDIVIFGGCTNNILDQRLPSVHTNEVILFRLSPKCLQRICFDVVFNMRERTQNDWDSLPYNIKNMLENKVKCVRKKRLSKPPEEAPQIDISRSTSSCVLS